MHADQSDKAAELVVALGVLARAQEFGGRAPEIRANDDDELLELTACVREAEHAFQAVYRPAQ